VRLSVRKLHRLLGAAALLMGAAAPTVLSQAPVHAAGACTTQGVTVVVDFGALGGGVQRDCASSAGKAAALFAAAGHSLGRVQSQPSAVCSVDSKPAKPCPQMPPANAYWGLFWTDGSTAKWTYASLGVDSLSVPAGGSVGFAWQSAAGTRAPAVSAAVTKAPTKPTKTTKSKSTKTGKAGAATKKPATKPSVTPTPAASPSLAASTSASMSPSAVASSAPSAKAKKHAHAGGTAASSPGPSAGALTATPSASSAPMSTDSAPTSPDSGGLPGWIAPLVVVVVLAAGGGVAVARRRARG